MQAQYQWDPASDADIRRNWYNHATHRFRDNVSQALTKAEKNANYRPPKHFREPHWEGMQRRWAEPRQRERRAVNVTNRARVLDQATTGATPMFVYRDRLVRYIK